MSAQGAETSSLRKDIVTGLAIGAAASAVWAAAWIGSPAPASPPAPPAVPSVFCPAGQYVAGVQADGWPKCEGGRP